MKNQGLKNVKMKWSKFPDAPGVYQFRRGNKIIYIGKATSLRDRVRSYMSSRVLDTRGPLIAKMLERFDKVEYIKTDSVLEALILEANLIKKHQPEANTIDKDDKSFNHVVITKEDFPRVLVVRGRELLQSNLHRVPLCNKHMGVSYVVEYSFGPFTNGGQLKEALKLVRKIFPYRDKCIPFSEVKDSKVRPLQSNSLRSNLGDFGRPCFNRQIGLCPGVCTGEISKADYAKQIRNIVLFFEGKKKQIVKNLEKQMRSFAKIREFEKANIIKRTLFALNHIQDVALIKDRSVKGLTLHNDGVFRIESYDIAHMSGQNVVGVMTVVENGEIKNSEYRKFKIRNIPALRQGYAGQTGNNDTRALSEVLARRLAHIEWRLPDLIVVDGGVAQKNVVEKILKNNGLKIPVVSVVKDERHKPREILGDLPAQAGKNYSDLEREILLSNSEAHRYAIAYHKKLRRRIV